MLRPPGDVGGDVHLVELALEDVGRLADMFVAVGAALADHRLDLRVLARVEGLEREVLELPLHRVDAEPVGEWRVDLERLPRLLDLFLLPEVLDRPEVVQPVGELDDDDPVVLGHREHHLPVVLGLRLLAALEVDAGQLRDAVDEPGDLVAELGADVVERDVGVLDDVVEQGGRNRLVVLPELGGDSSDCVGVVDEVLARAPQLAVMSGGREAERASDQVAIEIRVVLGDLCDQLVDQVWMAFRSLEKRHIQMVLRG